MRASKNNRQITLSDFYCVKCGCKGIPIMRVIGREREPGHLKRLFCLNCQDEVNMIEIRQKGKYTLDDFWIEFNYGNFNSEGNRIDPWKQFVSKVKQKGENNESSVHYGGDSGEREDHLCEEEFP